MKTGWIYGCLVSCCSFLCGCQSLGSAGGAVHEKVRVCIIGGMTDTGFWQALSERFEKETGDTIEVVATGPKDVIAEAFKTGGADLITMHASDTIINLCADGYAVNPQAWLKNDLLIVGPADDPAGIRGMKDAGAALAKISAKGSPFVVHSSLGAQEVMRDILTVGNVEINPDILTLIFSDRAREVLQISAEKHAYTIVGRIPFMNGKLPNAGLELMVRGDPLLRRPFVVAAADPRRFPGTHAAAASALIAFMRSQETQKWIATFGVGQLDDGPIFFPVESRASDPTSAGR